MTDVHRRRVLIVGGGFGGVKAALELGRHQQFEVTLLSDNPHFSYHPTLFRTATGGPKVQSSIPLHQIFDEKPVLLMAGTVVALDRKRKLVKTAEGDSFPYDTLILALGSVTNYFGIKGLQEYSYGTKSLEEVMKFKAHLHSQLADTHHADLNYVIVGGGPTGIELAGALPSYLKKIMKAHHVRGRRVHIDLIEAAPRLVPRMPKGMSRRLAKRLRKLGIKLYLGKTVEGETANALMVGGKPIQTHTVVWTAGMANHPFFKNNRFELNPKGKVVVDQHLEAEKDIYVIGDNADTPYSGMAQTALHDAKVVARNLVRRSKGEPLHAYKPKKPIYVFPAGPHWAAVLWGKLHIYGFLGWLLRTSADLLGYHDLQPWWRASGQWLTEFQTEEDCPTCAARNLR